MTNVVVGQRSRVVQLYKTLLYLGRDYPQGYDYFRGKCHGAFMRNKELPPEQVNIRRKDTSSNYKYRLRNGLPKEIT